MEDAYLDLKLVATKYLKRIGAISERFLEVPRILINSWGKIKSIWLALRPKNLS